MPCTKPPIRTAIRCKPLLLPEQGQFYLAPGVQWMNFDGKAMLDDEWGFSAGIGLDITDRISAELSTFEMDPDRLSGQGVDLDHYKLELLLDLGAPLGGFQSFVLGGVGNTEFGNDNDSLMSLGVGLEYELRDNLVWRTAFRSVHYRGRNFRENDYGVDSSLVFYFGGRSDSRTAARTARRSEPVPTAVSRPQAAVVETPAINDAGDNDVSVEELARIELRVNFDFDRAGVAPEYFPAIGRVVEFMAQYPEVAVELEGHTDSVGSVEYNRDLSRRRANAVRQVMIDRFNVQASRVTARGFGEEQPVATNDTAAGRAQNRRVITVIVRTGQDYQPR